MRSKTGYRFVIQALVVLVRGCIGLIWASAGPLLPLIMQEYGINRGSAAWFASAAPLTIAIFAVPLGVFMSRFSLKKAFAIGAFLQAAGILQPLLPGYVPLLLDRALFALGAVITVSVSSAITLEWFSERELPLINGITMSMVNLGNALSFMVTVPLAKAVSWNAPIFIYGVFALLCAAAWAVFGRDRRWKETVIESGTGSASPPEESKISIRRMLTNRSTLLLSLAVMGYWSLGNVMGAWLPSYYHEVFKMPLEKASSITAIVTATGTVSCIIGGILATRVGLRKPFLIIPGIFMGISAMSAVLFNHPVVIFLSVAAFGIFTTLQIPVLFSIPMEIPGMSLRAGVLAVYVMQCAGNFGNFVGPLVLGNLADRTGSYLPGFIIAAVGSLSLLAAGLLLPETGPRAKTQEMTWQAG